MRCQVNDESNFPLDINLIEQTPCCCFCCCCCCCYCCCYRCRRRCCCCCCLPSICTDFPRTTTTQSYPIFRFQFFPACHRKDNNHHGRISRRIPRFLRIVIIIIIIIVVVIIIVERQNDEGLIRPSSLPSSIVSIKTSISYHSSCVNYGRIHLLVLEKSG